MTNRALQIFAWTVLLAIAAATLSPIGLRPHLPMGVDIERVLAFFVVGLLFALAYPRHIWFAALVVLLGAFGLELLQELRADRHGRVHDALIKSAGASMGLGIGWLGAQIMNRWRFLRGRYR
ncbi:VanZ family protein [Devosia sp. BSSL-BM10]|uniref:VanZ family protein n=1 Tax=Devosia litorisediminis TaxID=2829817 RepID=A0A942E6V5_9HYPH|nr:VanZ family protein [Devosia litorisediminis]MBS3848537.1 VanZ family protein [Devosia litorisediminis]